MSRFLAILQASDPDLIANIQAAGGQIVSAHEPGVLIIDGGDSTRAAVAGMQAVRAAGPVDASWDTSDLQLDDSVATLVAMWNRGYSAEFVAAVNENYRDGEAWDMPDGCFQPGIEGEELAALPATFVQGDDTGTAIADNTDPNAGGTDPNAGSTDPNAGGTTGTTDSSGTGGAVADNTDTTDGQQNPDGSGDTPSDGSQV